jgi:hypothetical protein
MKRRQILITTGATIAAGWIPGQSMAAALGAGSSPVESPVCAMHRLDGAASACPSGMLRLLAVQVAETASPVRRFDLDLTWEGEAGQPMTLHAWRLQRSAAGTVSAGSTLRMRLPDARARVVATIDGRPLSGRHEAALELDAVSVIAAPRASTGLPPRRSDLAWNPTTRVLSLRDGTARDFDAVVIAIG